MHLNEVIIIFLSNIHSPNELIWTKLLRIQLKYSPDAASHFEKKFWLILLFSAILVENTKYFFSQPFQLKTMRIIHQKIQDFSADFMNY